MTTAVSKTCRVLVVLCIRNTHARGGSGRTHCVVNAVGKEEPAPERLELGALAEAVRAGLREALADEDTLREANHCCRSSSLKALTGIGARALAKIRGEDPWRRRSVGVALRSGPHPVPIVSGHPFEKNGGADRIRTCDPHNAMVSGPRDPCGPIYPRR